MVLLNFCGFSIFKNRVLKIHYEHILYKSLLAIPLSFCYCKGFGCIENDVHLVLELWVLFLS